MRNFIKMLFWALWILIPRQESWGGEEPRPVPDSGEKIISGGMSREGSATAPIPKESEALQKEAGRNLPLIGASSSTRLPLSIDSKEMTVKGQEGRVLFNGGVRIQHGDVTMKADHAEILLHDLEQNLPNGNTPPFMKGKEIAKIEVTRNVELKQGNRRVLAQRGSYDVHQQELVFSGEPEMWEDGYSVKGKVIILSLAQKRSIIEGSQLTID